VRLGVRVRKGTRVSGAEPNGARCRMQLEASSEEFTQVFLTTPTRLARSLAGGGLSPLLDEFEREYPSASKRVKQRAAFAGPTPGSSCSARNAAMRFFGLSAQRSTESMSLTWAASRNFRPPYFT